MLTGPRIPHRLRLPGNDWQRRETWDLIGIVFTGHPSLTRTVPDGPDTPAQDCRGIPIEFAVNASPLFVV